jgi:hypothetical protein
MKIQLQGAWHEILGQGPTPKELHRLYTEHDDVGGLIEHYPGEVGSMYRANGFVLRQAMKIPKGMLSGSVLVSERWLGHSEPSGIAGPAILDSIVWQGAIGLWLPVEVDLLG